MEKKIPLKIIFHAKEKKISRVSIDIHSGSLDWQLDDPSKDRSLYLQVESWIESYLQRKQPRKPLPILLEGLTDFTQNVLNALQEIPFGKTKSYKEVAAKIGNQDASRAVGSACGKNPCLLIVPCHRVLRHNSALGGFSAGLEIKKILLNFESTCRS